MIEEKLNLAIDSDDLKNIVQQVLGDSQIELKDWEVHQITGGLEIGSNVYRLSGTALSDKRLESWSLILKIIHPEEEFSDPEGFRYWRREIDAYQSGLLQSLMGKFSTPKIYELREKSDASVWIFMEDIRDEFEHPWVINQYEKTAHILGQFNGNYLKNKPLPQDQWVSSEWLLKYLKHAAPMLEFMRHNPTHPLIKSLFPGILLPLTMTLWDEHPKLIKILNTLPQTFCHQDAFPRNLFFRKGQLIAIDWGYAGIAPVGAELAPLVGTAVDLSGFPGDRLEELDQVCFSSYLEGIEEAAGSPDPDEVRLGFILTMTLRYVLGGVVGEVLPSLLNEETKHFWADGRGVSKKESEKTSEENAAYYTKIMMEMFKRLGLGFTLRFLGRTGIWALRFAVKK